MEHLRGEAWATKTGTVGWGELWGNQRSDKETREGGRGGEEARMRVGGGRVRGSEMVTSGIPTEQGREKPPRPEAERARG